MPRHIERFEKFSKHIPRLLRRQLIVNCLRQLRAQEHSLELSAFEHSLPKKNALVVEAVADDPFILTCEPSLERFHGVLLFIDISGFTMLSQKLQVDQLRKEINAYFKQLIDIIELCEGEVIKFAGDAIFVVWQSPVKSLDDVSFSEVCCKQVEKAIFCAKHINKSCSDYKIEYYTTEGVLDNVYLNVHSGLSVGLMAGIDIGSLDRWEYFIIGSPLQEAAEAESHATHGQLLISKHAHHVLHGNGVCTCRLVQDSCYLVGDLSPETTSSLSSLLSSNDHLADEYEELLEYDCQLYNDILLDIQYAERAVLQCGLLKRKRLEFVMNGVQGSLLDNIVRHCHEVVRVTYTFVDDWIKESVAAAGNSNRLDNTPFSPTGRHSREGFVDDVDPQSNHSNSIQSNANSESNSNHSNQSSVSSKRNVNASQAKNSFVNKLRKVATNRMQTLKEKYQARNERSIMNDSSLLADQREAIVMFINIALPKMQLFQSTSPSTDLLTHSNATSSKIVEVPDYHFFRCNEEEQLEDKKLVDQLQKCYDAILTSIQSCHGQMRQFIVDDKGTVCIVSFGLRGSMNNHTASDAIEASKLIIASLKALKINASIGLTSGKVYGGLVGSPKRHEYAVMGPSVNLAARLMGKCSHNDILCDNVVSSRDSLHHFFSKGSIVAKGYQAPVPTFSPIFPEMFSSYKVEDQMQYLQQLQNVTELVRFHSHLSQKNSFKVDMVPHSSPVSPRRKHRQPHTVHHSNRSVLGKVTAYGRSIETKQVCDALRALVLNPEDYYQEIEAHLCPSEEPECSVSFQHHDSNHNTSDDHSSTFQPLFRCDKDVTVVYVVGSTGMGKTHFCQSIFNRLHHMVDNTSTIQRWNLLLASNHGVMKSSDIFQDWKIVLPDLLAHFTQTCALISHEQQSLISSLHSFMKQDEKALLGLQHLVSKLSPSSQQALPYFVQMFPIFHGLDLSSPEMSTLHRKLSVAEQIQFIEALIVELLQLIVVESKCLVCIWMDDYDQMEKHSLSVLKKIQVQPAQGFFFLLTLSNVAVTPKEKHVLPANSSFPQIQVDLTHLSLHDVEQLSNEIFDIQLASISGNHDRKLPPAIAEKIFEASSGIPLYATEITKAFSKTFEALSDHFTSFSTANESLVQSEEMTQSILSMLQHLNIGRIEEVICFRFDQLSLPCQMLLKVITAATANGKAATLNMLASIVISTAGFGLEAFTAVLDELYEVDESSKSKLASDDAYHVMQLQKMQDCILGYIDEMLQVGDFLVEIANSTAAVRDNHVSLDSHDRSFTFQVDLERSTIYKMMLEEQRSFLHDKIATYLEELRVLVTSSNKEEHPVAQDMWAEEAFHWSAGHVWSSAMICYHQAAVAQSMQQSDERNIGLFQQSFSMLMNLQQEYITHKAGSLSPGSPSNRIELTLTSAVTTIPQYSPKNLPNISDKTSSTRSSFSVPSHRNSKVTALPELGLPYTRQLLFQIFGGDSELLDETLQMLVEFLSSCIQYQKSIENDHENSFEFGCNCVCQEMQTWISLITKHIASLLQGMLTNDSSPNLVLLQTTSNSSKLMNRTNSRKISRHHSFMQIAIEDFSIQHLPSKIPILQEIIRLFEVSELKLEPNVQKSTFEMLLQEINSCE